ncbi:hypothetical protein APHAL10511_007075 [Amanita phalloides]|nr:hypothetical protein APHAL10511_007075 [Amanita phalloides]
MSVSQSTRLTLQLKYAWRGLLDAFKWNSVLSTVADDAELRSNVIKSFVVNLLSLAFIYTFDVFLSPLVRHRPNWFHRNIGWFYQVLWLFPVISVSLYFNSLWCTAIARRTYMLKHGQHRQYTPSYSGLLNALAGSTYRIVMIVICLGSSFILGSIPYIGSFASFVFLCWVDAYYCFEFVLIAKEVSLAKRVQHIEERWAYYFAFGLPVTALCSWGTGLANAACFALIFPAYIILAMHARPVPLDPRRPETVDGYGQELKGSTFIPARLPIFTIVLWINDKIVNILSVRQSQSSTGDQSNGGHSFMRKSGWARDLSDDREYIEEGQTIYTKNHQLDGRSAFNEGRRQTIQRVAIRRKLE